MSNSRYVSDLVCGSKGHKFESLPVESASIPGPAGVSAGVVTTYKQICTQCGYDVKTINDMRATVARPRNKARKAGEESEASE